MSQFLPFSRATLSPPDRTFDATASHATVARRQSIPGLVRILFGLNLLLGVAHIVSHLVFDELLPKKVQISAGAANAAEYKFQWLSALFNMNFEANVPTWCSSVQLLLVGLLLGVFASAKFDRTQKAASGGLIAAAALFVALSLDEVAQFHENLGGKLVHLLKANHHDSAFTLVAFWIAVLIPFLIACACIIRAGWVHWRTRPAFARKFLIGATIFLGFAAGMELLWIAVIGGDPSASALEVAIEEVGELMGITIMVWATWDLLASERVTLSFQS
jgi:drug/metabolite transporter superfamily protein YnfA